MHLTQKNQLKGLSCREYQALKQLCHLSKNMYNVGMYSVRQHFFATGEYLDYNKNYHQCKNNENYKLLHSGISQQTLKVVDRSFKSFFELVELVKAGEYDASKVRIPKYLDKEGYFMLIIPQAKIEPDLSFYIPMTPAFKKQYGRIKLQMPERLRYRNIKEIRILPKYSARFFEIEYVYELEVESQNVNFDRALAIDPGLDNLVTCIDTNGSSFIVDGKYLKSINRWYNKQKARLQSILDKQKLGHFSNRQARITQKRSNRIRDYLNKTARRIINYCIAQGIGTIIFGCNPEQKQEINLGRRNNQNFVQIPHALLRQKVKGLCERYGLKYQEQEESYTSQASFIDADAIPVYGQVKNPSFSGKRIKRGLYKTKKGLLVNSDVNGAANILRKSSHRLDSQRVGRGLLNNPLRVNLVRIPAFKLC